MSLKRILVIAGSDSSGGAYANEDLCWPFINKLQGTGSRPEGHRRSWLLCYDSDHSLDGAKYARGARHTPYASAILEKAD